MGKKGFMTVGYGNMNVKEFINKIKSLRINCIVDVRTRPYSKYNLGFNKEELRDRLNDEGISYFWFGNKLGGRYDKIKYCNNQGIVDYEKVALCEKFIEGIKEFEKLIFKYNVCIMCSEKDPLKCHRFLLISRALKQYNIYHILSDGNLIKNADLERMMFSFHGNLNQLSLFDNEQESFEVRSYREQGFKTAYFSSKVKDLLSQGVTQDLPEKVKIYCIGCNEKTAEEFFSLLNEYKVKKIVDVRENNRDVNNVFAVYPDIVYYLKLHCIEYERITSLIPNLEIQAVKVDNVNKYLKKYGEYITQNNGLSSLLTDDLDGTCFLGTEADYKKCYRQVITRELKKLNSNISVKHLK